MQPTRLTRLIPMLILGLGLGTVHPQARLAILDETSRDLPRLSVGDATVERLGTVYEDGIGPSVLTRGGDWRLSNGQLTATFASVDDWLTTGSIALAGYQDRVQTENRLPGALIDLTPAGHTFDTLDFLTQSVGPVDDHIPIIFDTVTPLQRANAVGLRFEGSPFPNALARLRTTWWLAPGADRLEVQSELIGMPPGVPLPELRDLSQWNVGGLLSEHNGLLAPGLTTEAETGYVAAYNGAFSVGEFVTSGTLKASLGAGAHRLVGLQLTQTGDTGSTRTLGTRWIQVGDGHFESILPAMQRQRGAKLGTLTGQLTRDEQPVQTDPTLLTLFSVMPVDPEQPALGGLQGEPQIYSLIQTNPSGAFQMELPTGYYVLAPKLQLTPDQGASSLIRIRENQTYAVQVDAPASAPVTVQVIDAATSRPLPARIMFDPIPTKPPTAPIDFGPGTHSDAYFNFAYLPSEGKTFDLPEGKWRIRALHGIGYNMTETSLAAQAGTTQSITLAIRQTVPAEDWIGVEIGARTQATPGCTIAAEDYVRMAVAEGVQWLISGDFETVTDFGPVIRKLGLDGQIGSSRGFRTLLPAHPEWGHLLIYPLAPDAPDPAVAREQWASLTTSREWIAALRRLYPDALIQVELPFVNTGEGYFAVGEKLSLVVAYETDPNVELGVDAINILPARQNYDFNMNQSFWYTFKSRGVSFIPSTAAQARNIVGGEPGYPRMLVRTGSNDPGKVTEQQLITAMRKLRVQLTNGPLIELRSGDALPGDVVPYDPERRIEYRISAPNWIALSNVSLDKEGVAQGLRILSVDPELIQRIPDPENNIQWMNVSLADLHVLTFKDTLLGIKAFSNEAFGSLLPTIVPGLRLSPQALIAPILVDVNDNGKFDPLPTFGDMGR